MADVIPTIIGGALALKILDAKPIKRRKTMAKGRGMESERKAFVKAFHAAKKGLKKEYSSGVRKSKYKLKKAW